MKKGEKQGCEVIYPDFRSSTSLVAEIEELRDNLSYLPISGERHKLKKISALEKMIINKQNLSIILKDNEVIKLRNRVFRYQKRLVREVICRGQPIGIIHEIVPSHSNIEQLVKVSAKLMPLLYLKYVKNLRKYFIKLNELYSLLDSNDE